MRGCGSFALLSGVIACCHLGCSSSSDGGSSAGAGAGGMSSSAAGSSAKGGSTNGNAGSGTSSGGQGAGGTVSSAGGAPNTNGGAAPIGNAGSGGCTVPAAAMAEDVSKPTTVVGDGTAASCTGDKVVAAVAAGGVVTFSCGADPLTIIVPEISIINDGGASKDGSVTIDGGGKITLSGAGKNRILRQNTCDQALHWTTAHCNDQDTPHLVVQNIGFTAGAGMAEQADKMGLLGGGALYVGGGTFKAVNVTFSNNQQTNPSGQNVQDLAGGAIYSVNMSTTAGVYIVNATFDGNSGTNGGALGSIGTSWTILNSEFKNNAATGHGENPARSGTEGGGLGGAIYNDGNGYTLSICGSHFDSNQATELGSGAIFQVVDDLKGNLKISQSTFTGNTTMGDVQASAKHPGIYVQAQSKTDGTSGVTVSADTTFN